MGIVKEEIITATQEVDEAFAQILSLKNPDRGMYEFQLAVIENALRKIFSGNEEMEYSINVVYPKDNETFFVMAVFPEQSTMDRLIGAVISNKDESYMKELWRKNKFWRIEIDVRLLQQKFVHMTNRELSAILFHEVGHTVYSNTVIYRLNNVIKFEYQKFSLSLKQMLGSTMFQKVFRIPIIRGCLFNPDKENLRNEIRADEYAKTLGYRGELASSLGKLMNLPAFNPERDARDDIAFYTGYSKTILNQMANRRGRLVKESLNTLKESTCVEVLIECVDDIYNTFFVGSTQYGGMMSNEKKTEIIYETAEKLYDLDNLLVVSEGGLLGKKKLERIDPNDIDYIEVKLSDIKNSDDKLFLLGYIHNKIDTVTYYLNILNNKTYRNKYIIPHTKEELIMMMDRLVALRNSVMAYKIPTKPGLIYINYPKGYEG